MKKDSAKDIKIAFFDVDGTLVDMKKRMELFYVWQQDAAHILFHLFQELILMSFYLIMRLIVIQRMRLFFQILSQKKM